MCATRATNAQFREETRLTTFCMIQLNIAILINGFFEEVLVSEYERSKCADASGPRRSPVVVMLCESKFVCGCAVVACALFITGRFYVLSPALLGVKSF